MPAAQVAMSAVPGIAEVAVAKSGRDKRKCKINQDAKERI